MYCQTYRVFQEYKQEVFSITRKLLILVCWIVNKKSLIFEKSLTTGFLKNGLELFWQHGQGRMHRFILQDFLSLLGIGMNRYLKRLNVRKNASKFIDTSPKHNISRSWQDFNILAPPLSDVKFSFLKFGKKSTLSDKNAGFS